MERQQARIPEYQRVKLEDWKQTQVAFEQRTKVAPYVPSSKLKYDNSDDSELLDFLAFFPVQKLLNCRENMQKRLDARGNERNL